jgi:hypothetical protein
MNSSDDSQRVIGTVWAVIPPRTWSSASAASLQNDSELNSLSRYVGAVQWNGSCVAEGLADLTKYVDQDEGHLPGQQLITARQPYGAYNAHVPIVPRHAPPANIAGRLPSRRRPVGR